MHAPARHCFAASSGASQVAAGPRRRRPQVLQLSGKRICQLLHGCRRHPSSCGVLVLMLLKLLLLLLLLESCLAIWQQDQH